MKTDNFCKENRPEAKKKLRLPDQLELVMEDGTVYRVMFFVGACICYMLWASWYVTRLNARKR